MARPTVLRPARRGDVPGLDPKPSVLPLAPAFSADAPDPVLKAWLYAGFVAIVLGLIALDLGVFHRKARVIGMREALGWTSVWVTLALLFSVAVYFMYDARFLGLGLDVPVLGRPGETETLRAIDAFKLFLTGYVVEESLSLDNVFVIAMVFAALRIPPAYQHRVLFWGIIGALVLRGTMIFAGYELVRRVSWITYVFGGFLVFTALKMATVREEASDPEKGLAMRLAPRILPVSPRLDGQKLTTIIDGRRHATPLFVALVLVELTDVVFALDSIPAIFAITADPFLVFSSNVFAILGLRSLYFCLAAAMTSLRYLKPALVLVLLFIGVKMCLVHTPLKVPTDVALLVVLGLLGGGVVASLIARRREPKDATD